MKHSEYMQFRLLEMAGTGPSRISCSELALALSFAVPVDDYAFCTPGCVRSSVAEITSIYGALSSYGS